MPERMPNKMSKYRSDRMPNIMSDMRQIEYWLVGVNVIAPMNLPIIVMNGYSSMLVKWLVSWLGGWVPFFTDHYILHIDFYIILIYLNNQFSIIIFPAHKSTIWRLPKNRGTPKSLI